MLPHTLLTADAQAELALFTDALERFCDAEIEPHYRAWEKAGIVPRERFELTKDGRSVTLVETTRF